MKLIFGFLFFCTLCTDVFAQSNENRYDNFYLEAGGSGLFYSINLERSIPTTKLSGCTYAAGITPLFYRSDFSLGLSGSFKYYNNLSKVHQINYGVSLTYFTLSAFEVSPVELALFLPVVTNILFQITDCILALL